MDPKAHIDRAELQKNLEAVKRRIRAACSACNRSADEVALLAVSKGQPSEKVRVMYEFGLRDFGENYAQELVRKADELSDLKDIRWHFIGHLQSNKINALIKICHSISSISSLDHAKKLNRAAQSEQRMIKVKIELNVGGEQQKSGISLGAVPNLANQIAETCPSVSLQGVMVIPPTRDSEEAAQGKIPDSFVTARKIANAIGNGILSLGMSSDLESSIAAGSDEVRIGTSLFGDRNSA